MTLDDVARRFGSVAHQTAPDEHSVIGGHGRRITYLTWGPAGAPAIVFVHGGWLSSRSWDVVCAQLADRFRCVALDLRGHGSSDRAEPRAYGVGDFADDLEAVIRDASLEKTALVGMSVGGMACVRLTLRRPDLVRGVVLVDILPGVGRDRSDRGDPLAGITGSWEDVIGRLTAHNPLRDPYALAYFMANYLQPMEDSTWGWRHDPALGSAEVVAGMLSDQAELASEFAAVHQPVMIARGAHGDVDQARAEEWARRLPQARVVTIASAGHTVQEHNPVELARHIRDFMEELP